MRPSPGDARDASASSGLAGPAPRPASSTPLIGAMVLAANTLFLASAAYPRMFATLLARDDEGYFLITLRSFRQLGPLYDRVFTYYGPLYYLLMDAIFASLRLSISHDHGRFVSLGLWLAASLVCGGVLWRLTRSVWMGGLVQLGVFWSLLLPMPFEPMHPAVLLTPLLACLCGTALLVRRARLALALQGVLIAALALIKINVGAFALLAVALASVTAFPELRRRGLLAWTVAVAVALTPLALMAAKLEEAWVRNYVLLVTASIAGLALTLLSAGPVPRLASAPLVSGAASGLLTVLAVFAAILWRGTTLHGLFQALVVDPLRQAAVFTVPVVFPPYTGIMALGLAAAAILAIGASRGAGERPRRASAVVCAGIGRIAAGALLAVTAVQIDFGFLLVPFAWVAALRPQGVSDSPELAYARHLLPALAVMQTLQAYPVAGSHISWGSFLLIPIAGLCIVDGLRDLANLLASRSARAGSTLRWVAPGLGLLATAATAASLHAVLAPDRELYRAGVPLPLAGSIHLHVPPSQATSLVWLRNEILDHCTAFVSLPGLPSLHFWTGIAPPNGFNVGTWMYLFGPEIQRSILKRVRGVDRLCVVRNQLVLDLWRQGREIPPGPLVDYLAQNFTPIAHRRGYELLVRSEAAAHEGIQASAR